MSPTICLIHGHGVDATLWAGIDAGLSLNRPTFLFDYAYRTDLDTMEAYAEALRAELPQNPNGVVLIGHSMGGYIALAFAEQNPNLMRGLVLFHSTALADTDEKKEKRQATIQKLEEAGTRPFLETAIPNMVATDNRARMAHTISQLIDHNASIPAKALQQGLQAMMARRDRTDILRKADYPVLFVAGAHDALVPLESVKPQFRLAKQGRSVVLGASGHVGMLEQPAESRQAIDEFLAGV